MDKNYTVNFTSSGYRIKKVRTGEELSISEFESRLVNIFGNQVVDADGNTYLKLFFIWLKGNRGEYYISIYEYLNQCDIRITIGDWAVFKNGVKVTDDYIKQIYKYDYTPQEIHRLVEDWSYEKKIEKTEEELGLRKRVKAMMSKIC